MAKKKPTKFIQFSKDMLEAAGRSAGPLGDLAKADREYVLQRYGKFLALAKRYPKEQLAPTADIDEMWYLHMIMPLAYAKDCEEYFGQILDHNGGFVRRADEVGELKAIFDRTAKLWEEEFGEDYVVAGTASPLARCFSAATQAYSIIDFMIQIDFTDPESKRGALGKLAGRHPFQSWATGEMLVPEAALGYLAVEGVSFHVEGPAAYEQNTPALRGVAPAPIQ